MAHQMLSLPREQVQQRGFSPYTNNGGTTLGVAGKDFVVIAADTRMSTGYSIHTRNYTKVCKLTSKCVIASSGMAADIDALHKVLLHKMKTYRQHHGREPNTIACARVLSNTLYYKRFFPYYTFNVLAGLDSNGMGCCFSYDAIGTLERVQYASSGTGHELVQSLLDNQIGWKDQRSFRAIENLTKEIAIDLVKDALTSCGERDIYTGDSADICIITSDGIEVVKFALKED